MNLRPCIVMKKDEMFYGKCYGFGFKAWTHDASISVGGFPAGQESYAVGIVEFNDGHIEEVPIKYIQLIQEECDE